MVKPGDKLPIQGLRLRTPVSTKEKVIDKPLPGAGKPNMFCDAYKPKEADPTENAQSVGSVIGFGKFRVVDLGDLTWNKEHDLMCPNNKIGQTDVYIVSHHGQDISGSPVLGARAPSEGRAHE